MDHMYDKITSSSSSSSVSAPVACSASATDEISLFLQQILVRSSSSPSSASENLSRLCRSQLVGERISAVDSSGGYLAANTAAANLSSSSVGASENENDEYDCDSEEGQELEALVEEVPAKTLNARTSSKRSRAAEVHNLSEKRRRSRINEKMKALQNLIPNSNKTDKASMLDEAIEYLKQLQLQVQMLAMRNGLSLHPISLPSSGLQPAQLSQMRMDFGEENRPLHTNMTGTFPLNQETSTPNAFAVPNQSTSSNQQLVPNMLNIINSETTLGLDLPIQAPLGAFSLQSSAQGLCKEDRVRNQETNINHSETDFEMEAIAALAAFNRQASDIKGDNFVEACITEGDWSQSGLLRTIEHSLILPSNLHGMRTGFTGRSDPKDDIKVERANL